MRHWKLTLSYDGTEFAGWQVQPGQRTVQGALEEVLQQLTGQFVRVTGSGRTDAGVHALGQVAVFATESRLGDDVLLKALNAELPDDMAVHSVCEVPETFDPIRHAKRKRYRYVIDDNPIRDLFSRHYAWHFYAGRLDVPAMQRAAAPLQGTHDFASFESSGSQRATSIRTVFELSIERTLEEQREKEQGGRVTFEIEADGFLYNMVRIIVGTLVEVGRGVQPESWPAAVLAARDRTVAGPTAPPEGLILLGVRYE